jgi:hypothetical protein
VDPILEKSGLCASGIDPPRHSVHGVGWVLILQDLGKNNPVYEYHYCLDHVCDTLDDIDEDNDPYWEILYFYRETFS